MWRWRGPRRVRRLLKPGVPDNVREAALARSLAVSYERAHAGYDEALRALDEAIAALPRRPGAVGAHVERMARLVRSLRAATGAPA